MPAPRTPMQNLGLEHEHSRSSYDNISPGNTRKHASIGPSAEQAGLDVDMYSAGHGVQHATPQAVRC